MVRRLGGILGLADALDRSHTGAVRDAGIRPGRRRAVLWMQRRSPRAVEAERWDCAKKKVLFEEAFGLGLSLSFRSRRGVKP